MTQPGVIRVDHFYAHAPAAVWRALTEPELHARWFVPGDIRPRVGHRFDLDMGKWGKQACVVLEVEPERLLKYRFSEGHLDTSITWRLTPEASGTRLELIHEGFDLDSPLGRQAFEGMKPGWPGVLKSLEQALAGVPSPSRAALRIAIVGDFDRHKPSHWATEAALFHAAAKLELPLEPRWLGTAALAESLQPLAACDGVWGAPGSPYASAEGMLRAVRSVRETDQPYLGTCAGFQYALIELTRNVLGVADADSAENTPNGANVVITPVLCEAPSGASPRLAGAGVARVQPGTLVEQLCGPVDLRGEYFCSFETNAAFVPRWQRAGLRVAATGEDGEMRAFELSDRSFFVATLFQPQLSSTFAAPHPLVVGFLRACAHRAAR